MLPSWGPVRVLETGGKISGLEVVRCTSVFDENDRFAPAFDVCTRHTVEGDQIILAVGQKTDLSFLGPHPPVKVERGSIAVDEDTQATSVAGIFAGGDVTSGRGTVVEAMAAGRNAASAIDQHLRGTTVRGEDRCAESGRALLKFNSSYLTKTARAEMLNVPVAERELGTEDALGIAFDDVEKEANRCFNCGCVAASPSDVAPALIALGARIKTTRRTLTAEEFFAVGPVRSTVLDRDELVTEVHLPAPAPDNRQVFLKFRLRNSIDFPIVSVAAVISRRDGKVDSARIVLGAVAPIPLRMQAVEDFLIGKRIDAQVAEAAAALAVQGAIPLPKNAYKIQVARALVRRAILAAA